MFNNTNSIVTLDSAFAAETSPVPYTEPKTNREYVEAHLSKLEKADKLYIPDFPEYGDKKELTRITKSIDFTKMPSGQLSDEIHKYIVQRIGEGITYETLISLFKHLKRACIYINDVHPEITSASDVTPEIFDEMRNSSDLKSEARRVTNNFRAFVIAALERMKLESGIIWTPEMEMRGRVWDLDKIGLPYHGNSVRNRNTISFERISQDWLFKITAKYMKFRIPVVSIQTILSELRCIQYLSEALEENLPNVSSLDELTEDDGYEIIKYISQKDFQGTTMNSVVNALRNFFDNAWHYGIIKNDITGIFSMYRNARRIMEDPDVYSEVEIQRILQVLKYMPDQVARVIYILISSGLRPVDVLIMECKDTFYRMPDGSVHIQIVQHKTNKKVTIPCPDQNVVDFFGAAVHESREKHGEDCVYAFSPDDSDRPMLYDYVRSTAQNVISEHGVLDDQGNPLKLMLYMFRKTKASEYINKYGLDPDIVRKLLGHSDTRSLGYYAFISEAQYENAMAPVFEYMNSLIVGRGNIEEAKLCEEGQAFRLTDGFCVRPINKGICEKLGGCYTCRYFTAVESYLPYYRMQLEGFRLRLEYAEKHNQMLIIEQTKTTINNLERIISGIEISKAARKKEEA